LGWNSHSHRDCPERVAFKKPGREDWEYLSLEFLRLINHPAASVAKTKYTQKNACRFHVGRREECSLPSAVLIQIVSTSMVPLPRVAFAIRGRGNGQGTDSHPGA
jgi:hypothetical protein